MITGSRKWISLTIGVKMNTHTERGCDMTKKKYGVLAWNK